jgi:hypothetical protein
MKKQFLALGLLLSIGGIFAGETGEDGSCPTLPKRPSTTASYLDFKAAAVGAATVGVLSQVLGQQEPSLENLLLEGASGAFAGLAAGRFLGNKNTQQAFLSSVLGTGLMMGANRLLNK